MRALVERLRREGFEGELSPEAPLARLTPLRVGGMARLLAVPADERELTILLRELAARSLPWAVLGGGTNVLFRDEGFPGCILRLGKGFGGIERVGGETLEAGAAAATPLLVARAADAGMANLEFTAGIPGTIGGAVRMNAGSAGGDMASVVAEVRILQEGRAGWVAKSDLAFSYRNMALASDAVITAVRLRLARGEVEEISGRIRTLLEKRRATQPPQPSLGCWFRNPPGDSAGRIIDLAGLKGLRVGGAEVSVVHANFLVRAGAAKAGDFLSLAGRVRDEVAKRFGILLSEEVHVLPR